MIKIKKINLGVKIILICLALVIFGCVMVFSASSYASFKRYGNQFFFLNKQIVGALIGAAGMIALSFFDYHKLIKLRWWALGVSLILLVLVFVPHIGISNYGANRWVGFGSFSIQPSEIAKFVFVLFAAYYLSCNYNKIKSFKGALPLLLVGGVFCLLVILEPNMSITMCLGMVMLIMLFVGGGSLKTFLCVSLPALCAVPLLIVSEPYRMKRLVAFLDPWGSPQAEGFQLIQSLYSLGGGGLFGVGLGNSRQKFLFLPFSESDFIFSIIGEELGFFGATCLIVVFLILIVCLVKIALNAKDRFGTYLCIGVASVISIQVLINIAVVTGTIPPTGLPLPFISAGSTSLVMFMMAIGVCANVCRQSSRSASF
ncbi:MAG: putative lipid II flippase FtsW [Clostridia bacterium]